MKIKMWVMNVDQLEEFFRQSLYKEAVKQEEREAIADSLAEPIVVNGTEDEVVKALAKGHNVLRVKRKAK